jgi:deazaflavin-dependent oxidoreductase (nitroreductase family)
MSDATNWNKNVIEQYRANGGKMNGWNDGKNLLLLTTKGAKTGKEHINPVAFTRDGDRLIVIASKGGAPTNPDWYYNLMANPEVTVEVGREQFKARAKSTDEPERTRLYDKMVEVLPGFGEYPSKTTRKIPVVILEPIK